MLTTVEAEIETNGIVRLLEPVTIRRRSRAIVTILDEDSTDTNSQSEKTKLADDSESFGWWQGKEITKTEYLKLEHNEQIDFDLARSYSDTHEDGD